MVNIRMLACVRDAVKARSARWVVQNVKPDLAAGLADWWLCTLASGRYRIKTSILIPLAIATAIHSASGQTAGFITTIAGTAERGYGGDDGPATNALLALANRRGACVPIEFLEATRLSVDTDGSILLADSGNHRIRRITPAGQIRTVAGSGERPPIDSRCDPTGGSAAVGDGGAALASKLYSPADVIVDRDGNMIVADQLNHRIRRVTPSGTISTIAGNGTHNVYAPNAPALSSPLDYPASIALDPNGLLYFVEPESHRVGRVNADGRLATVAGTGAPGFRGDNVPAATSRLSTPAGIAFDAAGNLYIADRSNHRIRKVAPSGIISTVAGTGQAGFSGDGGPADRAQLNAPTDVEVDRDGNVFIADMLNHRVRRVDATGTITTVPATVSPVEAPTEYRRPPAALTSRPAWLWISAGRYISSTGRTS